MQRKRFLSGWRFLSNSPVYWQKSLAISPFIFASISLSERAGMTKIILEYLSYRSEIFCNFSKESGTWHRMVHGVTEIIDMHSP